MQGELVQVPQESGKKLSDNELTIIRLGEDPEQFDHYIFGAIKEI